MNNFESKVLNFIRKNGMVEPGDTVVVGLSGGADSTALLLCLSVLKGLLDISLVAVHVNHGIRQEAGEDQAFSEKLSEDLGIPIITVARDVPAMARQQGLSEEEAGRKARYEAFEEAAARYSSARIAVAHHQDDAAETLLLNLVRGSGLHGAGAIRPVRDNIIRPLLCVSRSEIEEYLWDKGQAYCVDKTNLENDYSRNVIRNMVMPLLNEKVNLRAAEHLYRAAESFAEADRYIRDEAGRSFDKLAKEIPQGFRFPAEELLKLPDVIRQNVILLCFEKMTVARKDISFAHVEAVLRLLGSLEGSARADLPYGIVARRDYNELFIIKGETSQEPGVEINALPPDGAETKIEIPVLGTAHIQVFAYNKEKVIPGDAYTKWFDYDRIQTAIFRRRQPGDEISIEQGGKLKKKQLSKFMTDEKIPRRVRDSMYILADGNQVLWVPGYRINAAYKISDNTQSVLAVNIKDGGKCNG
jgi:tRNA(Ile)-lysidine synthase